MRLKNILGILGTAATILLVPNIASASNLETKATSNSRVCIASRSDNGFVTNENKTIEYNTPVTLYAVVKTDSSGTPLYFCDTDSLIINGQKISQEHIRRFPGNYNSSWLKVEPNSQRWYSNATKGSNWDHWDTINYVETPIEKGNSIETNVASTLLNPIFVDGKPVGTMRYKLVVDNGSSKTETPGKESKFKGGISTEVHRISKKANTKNPIVNHAFSLCNDPYIWASSSYSGDKFDNQAQNFVGADCADFCVAAARLAGYTNLYYTSSAGVSNETEVIAKVNSVDENGRYLNGNHLVQAVIGDFIQWNGHIGILVDDNDPKGILNREDEVLHTLFTEPTLAKISQAYSGGFKVLRVK